MDSQLTAAIERLFADLSTPKQVRAIERGEPAAALWAAVQDSGFGDALVPEEAGGGGLPLSELFGVLLACGRHALPVPLGPTIFARAALAKGGREAPVGPITLAGSAVASSDGALECARVPFARVAQWVLVESDRELALLPVDEAEIAATGVHGSLEADLRWRPHSLQGARVGCALDLQAAGACVFATHMAGAMERVLEETVRYANERFQFGKSIGKFQAIQQQIAVLAEQVFASRMAAQMGCGAAGFEPEPLRSAVAKARTSEAVVAVANIAHAVHGAIGMTEEYDLQLFTRRLHEWRLAFGSEAYWHQRLGGALVRSPEASALGYIRERLTPFASEFVG